MTDPAGKGGTRPLRRRVRATAEWRRAYLRHVLYLANERAGEILTGVPGRWDGIYRWRAAGFSGEESSLKRARQCVESAAIYGAAQLVLF